jgi:hypothetical protein
MPRSDWIIFLQAFTGSVLAVAAGLKALDRISVGPFLLSLGFPVAFANGVGRTLPALEGAVGVTLIVGIIGAPITAVALALAVVFFATQIAGYRTGSGIDCRCFGVLDAHLSLLATMARSLLLLGATSTLLALQLKAGTPMTDSSPAISVPLVLGGLTGLGMLGALTLGGEVWRFSEQRPRLLSVAQTSPSSPPVAEG